MNRLIVKKLIFLFVFVFFGCSASIKKFKVGDIQSAEGVSYEPFFNKRQIAPLKAEWKELYFYLQKGHLLQSVGGKDPSYIYSYQLYKFIKSNFLKIYHTSFLQDYQNFTAVFGDPTITQELGGKLIVTYSKSVIGDPCQTCKYDLFGYTFDRSSQKLLKE